MREQIQRLNKTPGTEVQQGVMATGITETPNMPFVQQVQKKSTGAELAKTLGIVAEGAAKSYELYDGQKDEEAATQFAEDKFTYLEELNSLHSNADKVQWINNKTKELSQEGVSERYRELFLNNFDGFYNTFLKGQQEEGYKALEGQLFKDFQEGIVTGKSYEDITGKYNATLPKDRYHKVYSASILGQASFELAAVETDEDLLKFNEKFDAIKATYDNNPYAGGNSSQAGQTVNTNFKNTFNSLIASKKAALKTKWTETATNLETTTPGYSVYSKHLENGLKYGHITPTKANTMLTKEMRKYINKDATEAVNSLKNIDVETNPEEYNKKGQESLKKIETQLNRKLQLKIIGKEQAQKEYEDSINLYNKSSEQASLLVKLEDGDIISNAAVEKENREWYSETLNEHLLNALSSKNFTDFDADDITAIRTKHPSVYKKGLKTFIGQAVANLTEENFIESRKAILGINQRTGNNVLNNVTSDERDSIILMNVLPSFASYQRVMDKKNKTGWDYKKEKIPKEYQERYRDIINAAPLGERTNEELKLKAMLFAVDGANTEAIFKGFEEANKKKEVGNITYHESIYGGFTGASFKDKDGNPLVKYIDRAIEEVLKERNLDLDENNEYSLKVQDNKLYIYSYGSDILKVGGYDIEDKVKAYNRYDNIEDKRKAQGTFPTIDNIINKYKEPVKDTAKAIGSGLSESISTLGRKASGAVFDSKPIDFIQKTFDIRIDGEKTYKED